MSSLFQGLTVNGKLKTTAGPPVSFFRGLGFAADGGLAIGSGPAVAYTAGIPTNATGQIVASSNAPTQLGPGALPLDATGAVCFRDTVPITYSNGVGYDNVGAIAKGFSGSDLFASGEVGGWWDPSDLTTMFQAGGTTTATLPAAVDLGVGVILDKSVVTELFQSLTAAGATAYSNSSIAISGSVLTVTCTTAGTYGVNLNNITLAAGKTYRVAFEFLSQSAVSQIFLDLGGRNLSLPLTPPASTIVAALNITTPAIKPLFFKTAGVIGDTFSLRITSISEMTSNFLQQATASAKPTLRFASGAYYLEFDGNDDCLSAATFNLSTTDKVFVTAGALKGSDATFGMLVEYSASTALNNGSFNVTAPVGAGQTSIGFSSKGTIAAAASYNNAAVAAGIGFVVTGYGQINNDVATLRVNGVQQANTVTDQGTGPYGNFSFFVGRRNNNASSFTGRLFGLIVRGGTTTAAQMQGAESLMASKMGSLAPVMP